MITPTIRRERATVDDDTATLPRDEERTVGGWSISFPAGVYRPIYRTISGTIYRPERPVCVNGVPWEHAGVLITHDGTHAFQFNENQVLMQALDQLLHFNACALGQSDVAHGHRPVRPGEFDLRLKRDPPAIEPRE